jgi:hypothetical protein
MHYTGRQLRDTLHDAPGLDLGFVRTTGFTR